MEDVLLKKKRGRKPKSLTNEETKIQVKKKDQQIKNIPITTSIIQELILHIPLNIEKYENKNKVIENEQPLAANSYIQDEFSYCQEKTNFIERNFENTVESLLEQFKESNNKEIYPSKTNIYCWWCCHPFGNTPISLPIRYKKNKYDVIGVFCGYNCACAYNNVFSGSKCAERNSLLHQIYREIYKENVIIKPSPPKEILNIFGGIMTIDEYRKNLLLNDFDVHINYPPLTSIIPQMEVINNRISNIDYIPISKKKIEIIETNQKNKITSIIKTKRNTIDTFMNIKIED
jgi:hypothetical protein